MLTLPCWFCLSGNHFNKFQRYQAIPYRPDLKLRLNKVSISAKSILNASLALPGSVRNSGDWPGSTTIIAVLGDHSDSYTLSYYRQCCSRSKIIPRSLGAELAPVAEVTGIRSQFEHVASCWSLLWACCGSLCGRCVPTTTSV